MTDHVVIHAPCGALRGLSQRGVVTFQGIPYAAPPVGPRRWRAPQRLAKWQGVRDALEFGPDLPQSPNDKLRGPRQDEDCLYLNVWAPDNAEPGSLPVLVWFYGGGFVAGSGSDVLSDGARMASHGAVVVSFNYRAGIFGFLAHPQLSAESPHRTSGNWGLLDQAAALNWVRENIHAFGGNAQKVCAFGVSAGSASISLMLASQQFGGLFDSAALQSPGAGRPLASLEDAERAGAALAADIDELRALPFDKILALTSRLTPAVRGLTTPRVLRPIRDGWLLPEDERAVFGSGRIRPMPLLIGSNRDEGSLLTRGWPVTSVGDWRAQIAGNFAKAETEAAALYPVRTDADASAAVAAMFADTQFNYGTRLLARSMAQVEPRTWRYLFTRRAPGRQDGPHHAEEVPYVFGHLDTVRDADTQDRRLSDLMLSHWVAFARTGDPNLPGATHWAPYVPAVDNYLEFGDSVVAGTAWRSPQLDFLERYFEGPS